MEKGQESIVQFAPLQSFVSPTFWHKLAEIKLDYDRLDDAPRLIYGYYTNRNAKSCLLEVDYSAFNRNFGPPKFCHTALGTIYNKNTIEEFKTCDKNELLLLEGTKLLEDFRSERVLEDVSRLVRFLVLSFADLKNHMYYYWFAFPCPLTPILEEQGQGCRLQDKPGLEKLLVSALNNMSSNAERNFFVVRVNERDQSSIPLKHFIAMAKDLDGKALEDYYFCFADPSEYVQPSWLMRVYAAFLFYKCPQLVGETVRFLGLRFDNQMQLGQSMLWQVRQTEPSSLEDISEVKFVGWELNRNQKMGPRMVSMRESMDPVVLAENSVNLNLKLMKWRLLPELNLEIISSTKCLLFGAGTLGCAVARNLLGWGFKYITLIDNGKVNFSNPVRQNLFTHADAVAGNAMKAVVAAQRLREINPSAITAGHVIQIPMPGHTIGELLQQHTNEDVNRLRQLVLDHDVLFLLTDSRESRWLPTLLGAAHEKIVINTALGFDSYLVQRHGTTGPTEPAGDTSDATTVGGLKCISGNELGCYFCNDVIAPGNSLKDRTLDQQCTVTRPGVSNIAASYAVELLVSVLQHPQRALAPAYYAATSAAANTNTKPPEGLLGIVPHSIRGMLYNFENILPATQRFRQCIACSEKVISEYRLHGNAFLFKVFESAKYLEDLTGISEFKDLKNEIIDYDEFDMETPDE